jgi:hypothetical protein
MRRRTKKATKGLRIFVRRSENADRILRRFRTPDELTQINCETIQAGPINRRIYLQERA